jgi:hypothetical protein
MRILLNIIAGLGVCLLLILTLDVPLSEAAIVSTALTVGFICY